MRKNVLIVVLVLGAAIAWRLWREFGRRPLAAQPDYGSPANPVFPPPTTHTADVPAVATPTAPATSPASMALQDYVAPPETDTPDDMVVDVHSFAFEAASAPAPEKATSEAADTTSTTLPDIDEPSSEAADTTSTTLPDIDEPADAEPTPEAPEEHHAPDDLIRIEGIGPKISTIVVAAGITTFAELAATDVERLSTILRDAGIHTANPSTWPDQAQLAAQGDWAGLKELQDRIKNGRVER